MSIPIVGQPTLPGGETANPKTIASKINGMFTEMMLKSMEDTVGAEDGLFGNSSSAEIYRGMLRENLAATMAKSLKSPFDAQFEQGMQRKISHAASATAPATSASPTFRTSPAVAPTSPAAAPSGNSGGGLPVKGVITSPIGWRRDPIDGAVKFHKGTDIAAAYGSDVKSVSDGVVVESGPKGGYGNAVVIQLADGRKMLYGHNSANLVQVGDRVQQGNVIAQVGATGHATGPHVHFEIIDAPSQISLKSGSRSSDTGSGMEFHQPTKDDSGGQNE